MATPLAPRVVKTMYRCLLRACQNGRNPAAFGPFGAKASFSFADRHGVDCRFPSSSNEVRRILRYSFTHPMNGSREEDRYSIDPFAALRHTNTAAAILSPTKLPSSLPIFDYTLSAALPGEEVSFNFFEPRYLKLVEISKQNDGYFILRVGRAGSILLQIQQKTLADGNILVQCIAGPRIKIQEEDTMEILRDSSSKDTKEDSLPPLAIATEFEIWKEDDNVAIWLVDDPKYARDESKNAEAERSALAEQRHHILDLLGSLTDLDGTVSRVGLPPIDPEDFSLWSLRFVLSANDIASRQKWLFRCQSSSQRLDYVQDFLENLMERRQADLRLR